ncbi:hypothetical protein C1T31_10195 [Hanstruepera neustonica]|uniref:GW domain-containing protein n=1 Tax=Hanstruepera neustonica TaxID=1445657 RepID=A0A2K1DXV9_9FLAO|nr:hypothetical protein [Hanstruepera neustonica]PNQ72864.1 hypothetical protein C1T31_10195 [Hanstruepera neustonica]
MTRTPLTLTLIFSILFINSCKQGPKVITATEDSKDQPSSGIFDNTQTNNSNTSESTASSNGFMENLHAVVVNKTLPTDKYIYMNVTENGRSFWIATRNQDVTIGETYFYKDALLKTNFESKEYQKTFDTIYLVSNIVPKVHGGNSSMNTADNFKTHTNHDHSAPASTSENTPTTPQKGTVSIADVVNNVEQYENQVVEITGKIVKVNPNIMDRNWYHLQDGTQDDYDFVVTSNTYIPEGHTVTVKAVVHRDVDFGAGYRYDLILENGEITKH